MDITDVRIRRVRKSGKVRGVVSITIDNEFVIHDIKIIEGENVLFIAMPRRKIIGGEFKDIAHPIISNTREKIQNAILVQYNSIISEKNKNISEQENFDKFDKKEESII